MHDNEETRNCKKYTEIKILILLLLRNLYYILLLQSSVSALLGVTQHVRYLKKKRFRRKFSRSSAPAQSSRVEAV